ncbi:uncharacterized protein PAC_17705 [Phialocephala subalpina]|uniref:Major facilitator superfamily (MFS) profile domain-containing protein n=1 Tax=Phialocephala subalpina TaxID=576137 RepID=A0A1L7XRX2_9HELO|nr:uncharacterized protein PAC_17705 [Phialocephala subalpina]
MKSTATTSTMTSKRDSHEFPGSVYLISSSGQMLSLPIPTSSPRDPLNWSKTRRSAAFISLMLFAVLSFVLVEGASIMFKPLAQEFSPADTKPFSLDTLVSAPTLFMGVGAFVWVPLTLAIGRRPVFLIATTLLLAAAIWAGLAHKFYELLVSVCLMGFAGGFAISAALLMAIDLTFIHQRPQAIAIILCLTASISLGILSLIPQIPGFDKTWRFFYMALVIPCAASLLSSFFLYPETYFLRPALAFDGRVLVQSATEKVQIYEEWEEVPGGKTLPETPDESDWWNTMRVWRTTRGGFKAMLACYPQILLCFCNPLIFWVALLNAVNFVGMMSIGETYYTLLISEPYSLPIHLIALVNLSAAVGSLIAWPASGIMISWISRRLTIRNKGVRNAEHYLPAFVLPVLAGAVSVVIYGFAAEYKWHWRWIFISYALNGFSYSGLATANTLWATEAFPRWAAPALVVVGGGSYVASFGSSYFILPWLRSQGYARMNIEIAVLIVVIGFSVVPVAFRGKNLRQYIHGRWGISEAGALRPQ